MPSRWGPAGAVVVGLVAAAPLVRVPFFASDDGLVHLWRLWEYARVGAASGLPVRWAPDAAYGFGTPLFTFYNPLAYALGALPVWLGTTAADATKVVFALSFVLAALGAYLLGASWNPRHPLAAGLCAALLYTLVPYRLATVYQRGALAEALGLALAPWVVLAVLRASEPFVSFGAERGASDVPVATGGGGRSDRRYASPPRAPRNDIRSSRASIAFLALASGALILSHTIAALLTLPFAGALGLARLFELRSPLRLRAFLTLSAGLLLGLLLGAVYWLPAFAEQSTVHLDRARWTEVGGGFLGSFEWPWQLVQPTVLHDYARDVAATRAAPHRFPRLPALAALALALGLLAGIRSGSLRRPTGLVTLLGLAVALALASPPALPLWRQVDLLASVQLGWRFLAVILVMSIPLAASLPDLGELVRPQPRHDEAVRAGRPGRLRDAPAVGPGPAEAPAVRRPAVSASPASSFLDAVAFRGLAARRLGPSLGVALALLVAVASLVRLPVTAMPWSAARERPAELAAFERKTGEFALGALREYVPRAGDVTPEQLALEPADPIGSSTAEVDARLLSAPVGERRYALAAAAPATVVFDFFAHPALVARLDGQPAAIRPIGDDGLAAVDLPPGQHELSVAPEATEIERAAGWLALAGLATTLALAAASALPRRRASLAAVPTAALLLFPLAAIAGPVALPAPAAAAATVTSPLALTPPAALGPARLLGASPDLSLVSRLGILTVDLDLQAVRQLDRNESLRLWLTDPAGRVVAESVGGPAGGLRPTTRWRPNQLLRLRDELRLLPSLPAGRYTLGVDLAGATATVGQIDLPAAGLVEPAALGDPFARHESIFGDELVLDGYAYDKDPSARPLRGSFWWRRVRDGASLYDATLRLLDKQGALLAEETRRMGGAGELRPQADFALLPAAPLRPESYRLELLVRPVGGAPLPARTFDGQPADALLLAWLDFRDPCSCLPPDATPLTARFADGITLAGWSATRSAGDLGITLYWRADRPPTRDYTVFLHVLEGDRIVAQADDQPNGGHRPTSAWQPGDVVRDHYRLQTPAGAGAAVKVGLYRPAENARLPLDPPAEENAVVLPLPAGVR